VYPKFSPLSAYSHRPVPSRKPHRTLCLQGEAAIVTLLGGAAAAWPLGAGAQAKRARIGWFTVAPHPYIDGFRRGLRELGWTPLQNRVRSTLFSGRTASSWRFRSRKTGICGWSTPGSDDAKWREGLF
jgi:hypothetical protein